MTISEGAREILIAFELTSEPGISELRRLIEAMEGPRPRTVWGKVLDWVEVEGGIESAARGEGPLSIVVPEGSPSFPVFSLNVRPPAIHYRMEDGDEIEVREPVFAETPIRIATLATGASNDHKEREWVEKLFLRTADAARKIFASPFVFGGPRALFGIPGDARLRAWPLTYYAKERLPAAELLEAAAYVDQTPDGGAWVLAYLDPFEDSAEASAARQALAASLRLE